MIIGIDCSRAFLVDRTGTENYSYNLVTQMMELPEAKSHLFVLFIRPNAIIPDSIRKKNVVIKPIKFRYLWTQVGLAWQTWREPRIDVLWIPAHTLPMLRNPWIKTVVTIHGLEYQWLKEYKNLLQRWYLPLSTVYAAKYADRVIAVSEFTKQQLEQDLHTSSKKIKVVQEGANVPTNQYARESKRNTLDKYGLQEKKYILFVGSLQPRKNLPALIEAFAWFGHDNPDYKLVIAGGSGWLVEEIFQAPGKFKITERVVFTGRVSDEELTILYSQAKVYVQPSITEGFGLPILEAMAAGIPVVVSDGGALTEVVGPAGTIVSLKQDRFSQRLASAMQKLVSDEKLRAKFSLAGSVRAKKFGWDKAAKLTLQALIF